MTISRPQDRHCKALAEAIQEKFMNNILNSCKFLVLLLLLFISSCSTAPKYSPKVKAMMEFQSAVAKKYGNKNAKLITKYDAFGIDPRFGATAKCHISKLYTDAYNNNVSYNSYIKILKNSMHNLNTMNKNHMEEHLYNKLSSMAYRYNKMSDSLRLKPSRYKPKKRDMASMLKSLDKFNAKLTSIPMISPVYNMNISSRYGNRLHPIDGHNKFHSGIDIVSKDGDLAVIAVNDGVVEYIGHSKGYGLSIILNHGNRVTTKYAHLSKVLVMNNNKVTAGQTIGIMGNSGKSTNVHLHFEVRLNNKHLEPSYYFSMPNCRY